MVLGFRQVSAYICNSFGVNELTICSGGRMCVGSHLAVYRKFTVPLTFSIRPQARILQVGLCSCGITDWQLEEDY